jgi:hypothetical protein
MLLQPTLDARYLPAGLDNEAAIRRAVADGTLREPLYPSLQLADDRAFVWLSQFGRSTLGMHSNTLVRCAGTNGFRLLLDSDDCADAQAPSLHFANARAWGFPSAGSARHPARNARCHAGTWTRRACSTARG